MVTEEMVCDRFCQDICEFTDIKVENEIFKNVVDINDYKELMSDRNKQ